MYVYLAGITTQLTISYPLYATVLCEVILLMVGNIKNEENCHFTCYPIPTLQ